jgi:hypothetical protein
MRQEGNPSHYTHILCPRNATVKHNVITLLARLENDKTFELEPFHRSQSPKLDESE